MTVSPDLTSLALCSIISTLPLTIPSLAGRRKSSQSNLDRTSQLHELCLFPVGLVRFNLPPVRHVAAVAAVELLRNVVVTSWALIPIVLLRFHCFVFSFKFCLIALAPLSVIQTRTSIKALKRLFLDLRRHSIDSLQPRLTLVFPCEEKLPPSVLNFTVLYYRARDTHDGQWCVQ